MKNAIIEKLRAHLAHPVDSECEVVYLLCEVRKLLLKKDPDTATLRLHCNWALHVDLEMPATTLAFLRRVDSYVWRAFQTPSVTILVDADGKTTCHITDDPVLEDFRSSTSFAYAATRTGDWRHGSSSASTVYLRTYRDSSHCCGITRRVRLVA